MKNLEEEDIERVMAQPGIAMPSSDSEVPERDGAGEEVWSRRTPSRLALYAQAKDMPASNAVS